MARREGEGATILAARESGEGVFRVRPAERRRITAAGVLVGLLVAVLVAVAGFSGGGAAPGVPWGPAAAERAAAVPAPGLGNVDARYRAAMALGREGRYLQARAVMLPLVPFRRSEAAVRAWSIRAAQGFLAQARDVRVTDPDQARVLVDRAAALAPDLDSLEEVRDLVEGTPSP